jgi:hypothetical protein
MTRKRSIVVAGLVGAVLAAWIHGGESIRAATPPVIDPANYVAKIDNPFNPLKPHSTYTYTGVTADGQERDTVEVTSQTKVIMGVTCVVVLDTAFVNGELSELTYDFFAQDKQGNVWYFGEDTKEYSGGVVVSTEGTWEAGVNGALPGIVMEAHPQIGDVYQQENAKRVAQDTAEVLKISPATVKREWAMAKAWLHREMHT